MDLLTRNPFRLANLPSTARLDEVKARLNEAEMRQRVGLEFFVPLQAELGALGDLGVLRSQVGSLAADPARQCCYRLLWPQAGWPGEGLDLEACLSGLPGPDSWTPAEAHLAFVAYLVRFAGHRDPADAARAATAWSCLDFSALEGAVEHEASEGNWREESRSRVEEFLADCLLRGASSLRAQGRKRACMSVLDLAWRLWNAKPPLRSRVMACRVQLGDDLEKALKKSTATLRWTPNFQDPGGLDRRILRRLVTRCRGSASQVRFWNEALQGWTAAVASGMQDHALLLARKNDLRGAEALLKRAQRLGPSPKAKALLAQQLADLQQARRQADNRQPTLVPAPPLVHPREPSKSGVEPPASSTRMAIAFILLFLVASFFVKVLNHQEEPSAGSPYSSALPPVAVDPAPPLPPPAPLSAQAESSKTDTPRPAPPDEGPSFAEFLEQWEASQAPPGAKPKPMSKPPRKPDLQRSRRLAEEHAALRADLDRLYDQIARDAPDVKWEESDLDDLERQVDGARLDVNSDDQDAVLDFKAQEELYNQKLTAYTAHVRAFNKRVDEYNRKQKRLDEIERHWTD